MKRMFVLVIHDVFREMASFGPTATDDVPRGLHIYGNARFQVLTRPFKKIAKKLGTTGKPEIEPATDPVVIRQVAEPSLWHRKDNYR
jgi:hypothetical protein